MAVSSVLYDVVILGVLCVMTPIPPPPLWSGLEEPSVKIRRLDSGSDVALG